MKRIKRFEAITLSEVEKECFAKSIIPFRFEPHLEVDHKELLRPHREEDYKNDLYTTLNVIQENLIRGDVSGVNKESGRRFTSKKISSISKDFEINRAVWDMAEKIASIKEPSYFTYSGAL